MALSLTPNHAHNNNLLKGKVPFSPKCPVRRPTVRPPSMHSALTQSEAFDAPKKKSSGMATRARGLGPARTRHALAGMACMGETKAEDAGGTEGRTGGTLANAPKVGTWRDGDSRGKRPFGDKGGRGRKAASVRLPCNAGLFL